MSSVVNDTKIPNNVDLASDKRLHSIEFRNLPT